MPSIVDIHRDPGVPGERPGRHPLARLRWVIAGALVVLVVVGAGVASLARTGDVAPVRVFDPPSATPSLSTPLLPVDHWEQAFLAQWDNSSRTALPLSESPDSWDHYGLAYELDANTAMFRATDKTQYLDRALRYIDNVVASARVSSSIPTSQYRDRYLGWISQRRDLGRTGTEVPLYESYLWRYATTTLRVMRQTPAVYDDPHYRAEYDRLLSFAEVNIFEKWYSRGANDNIYASTTHMASHWALIALNLARITTDPQRQERYQTVVDNIDLHLPNASSSLHQQMIRSPADGSAYFWNAEWGSFRRPGQDVAHGNGVAAYVVESAGQGGSWTATDLDRFVVVVTTVIRPHDGVFPAYVDGSGSYNGWISDGFVKFARHSAVAQQQLEQYPVANNQFIANMALNARILS